MATDREKLLDLFNEALEDLSSLEAEEEAQATFDTRFEELGLDDEDILRLIEVLEETAGVELKLTLNVVDCQTVGELIDAVLLLQHRKTSGC